MLPIQDADVEISEAPPVVARLSELELDRLVADMNRDGYGVIEHLVGPGELECMRSFVADAIASAGQRYVGFVGRDAVAGSVFERVGWSAEFRSLMIQIYERGMGTRAPDVDLHQVLRILSGESGKAQSLIFHYDSFIVTALIPVRIPRSDRSGDLIMLRHRRRVRQTYLGNLVDKVLLDNSATQSLLRLLHRWRLLPVIRIKMVPGNAYFFWGYSSIHANEACDPQSVRATAIYHFANPHAENKFRAKVRALIPR